MSRALCAGLASAWLAASVSLWAADVWESKPFHAWTDKELENVLTSSPWAGKGSVTYVQSRSQPIQDEAVVTWLSARVMRQALARREYGPTQDIPKRAQDIIAQTPTVYIVTVKISKGPSSGSHAGRAETMLNETFLQLPGKPPIPASQADGEVVRQDGKPLAALEEPAFRAGEVNAGGPMVFAAAAQRGGGGGGTGGGGGGGARGGAPTGGERGGARGDARGRGARGTFGPVSGASSLLTFRFPRDPITLEDKEVEFVTKLCGGGGGGPVPLPDFQQLNSAAAPQRGAGGGAVGFPGDLGNPPTQTAAQGPACNYIVKKKFKLKDMVVGGELLL